MSSKAVIIGAGIAGLASAIRLAVQGFEVTVFEKNSYPGGKISDLVLDGYHFDAGPSLFTQPENIEALFALAGEPMEEYFSCQKLPVSANYFYEDGTRVTAYADRELFAKELSEKMGETEENVVSYLKKAAKIYTDIGTVFTDHSLHKRKTFFNRRILKALKATRWPYLFRTMHRVNESHFSNPKTVQLFNRYATYNGSNPYKAPGMLSLIPHLEHNEGSFFPKNGMVSIANALYKLAEKKGVVFHFNTPVQNIIRHENRAIGVVVNNENTMTDIVVSNMDVYFTYHTLLNDTRKSKKILKQERSSSAMIFYWGIKKEFAELGLHNIFFAKDYQAEFDHIFRQKKMYADPTVYINITSKIEPGNHAPTGKENWFVMVNVPANAGQNWQSYREKYRQAIIEKINRQLQTDIEPLIETEQVLDPVLIELQTGSYRGSLYGTSSNAKISAFLRHPNFTNVTRGLYFVGGSVHPGGGIPLCLKSAKIMSEIVENDTKKNKGH